MNASTPLQSKSCANNSSIISLYQTKNILIFNQANGQDLQEIAENEARAFACKMM